MHKPTWKILNLNISTPRQKLKNLVHKILGNELLSPIIFFLASKLREEV